MPKAIIIGGPNGAGKTTASRRLLLEVDDCIEFVNADEIARGISPYNPDGAAVQASKLMHKRMHELREKKTSFAMETTMASRSFGPFLRDCKAMGYFVEAYYFMVESPEFSIARVAQRVALGGHDVPPDVIRRRFWAGAANFIHLYIPVADDWVCYYSGVTPPQLVAEKGLRGPDVKDESRWKLLQEIARGNKI